MPTHLKNDITFPLYCEYFLLFCCKYVFIIYQRSYLQHVGRDLVPQPDHTIEGGRQKVDGGPALAATPGRFRLHVMAVCQFRVTGTGHALLSDCSLGGQRHSRFRSVHFVGSDVPVTAGTGRHFHRMPLRAAVLVPAGNESGQISHNHIIIKCHMVQNPEMTLRYDLYVGRISS